MSKAILVIDMPERCSQCIFRKDTEEGYSFCGAPGKGFDYQVNDWMMSRPIGKPDCCPLRELPERRKLSDEADTLDYNTIQNIGFNKCLDEITGGSVDESVN